VTDSQTIGFIGLGVMGGPMCRNIAKKHAGLVGTDAPVFARVKPLLDFMGSDVTHCGGVGCGQVVKLKAMLPWSFPEKAFPPEYVLKDLDYMLQLAAELGVRPNVAELARRYYDATNSRSLILLPLQTATHAPIRKSR
jgi:3-hydroxyisobutyrate dehydrogenase-like beta-hydroxyacid dehydrogenase